METHFIHPIVDTVINELAPLKSFSLGAFITLYLFVTIDGWKIKRKPKCFFIAELGPKSNWEYNLPVGRKW